MTYRLLGITAALAATLPLLGTRPAAAEPQAPTATLVAPAQQFKNLPARQAAERIAKATGVPVIADRSVGSYPVTLDLPAGALEPSLEKLAAALPEGTVVHKAFLSEPGAGEPAPDPDRIAALILAQDALAGVKAPLATGEVILQGRKMSAEQAAPIIAALSLKPVYLLANDRVATDPMLRIGAMQMEGLKLWMGLTPEQQSKVAEQQFNSLVNMDPEMRRSLFANQMQMGKVMIERMNSLPPDQKASLFRDMTGGKWDGTGMPPADMVPGGQKPPAPDAEPANPPNQAPR